MLVLQYEETEMVGIFHKWKYSQKKRSYLIRLAMKTSPLSRKKHYFTLFSRIEMFFFFIIFSLLQTTKLNMKWPTTLQQHLTNCLAPTRWTLASVKRVLDDFLGPKTTPTTWNLDIKLKVFKREDKNTEFRLRQNLSMGEADFNQFIRQRNQLVVAADNFLRKQNFSPVQIYTVQRHGGAAEACSQGD